MEQNNTLQQGVFLKAEAIPHIEGKDTFLLGVGEDSEDCYVVRQVPARHPRWSPSSTARRASHTP